MRYDSQYGGNDVLDHTKTNADLYFYLCRSETFRIFGFEYLESFQPSVLGIHNAFDICTTGISSNSEG